MTILIVTNILLYVIIYNKNAVGRKRYHHPQVTAADIMEQK